MLMLIFPFLILILVDLLIDVLLDLQPGVAPEVVRTYSDLLPPLARTDA